MSNYFASSNQFLARGAACNVGLARCEVIILSLNLHAELPSGNRCLDFGISHDSLNKRDKVALERSPKLLALEVLYDFLVTLQAAPHECVIRTGHP